MVGAAEPEAPTRVQLCGSFAVSTFLCVPHAVSEGAADALGNQAGEAGLRPVLAEAVSRRSGGWRRPRSTWCTKPVRDRRTGQPREPRC